VLFLYTPEQSPWNMNLQRRGGDHPSHVHGCHDHRPARQFAPVPAKQRRAGVPANKGAHIVGGGLPLSKQTNKKYALFFPVEERALFRRVQDTSVLAVHEPVPAARGFGAALRAASCVFDGPVLRQLVSSEAFEALVAANSNHQTEPQQIH